MNSEKLIRSIKKELLFFKKKRKEMQEFFFRSINNLLDEKDYQFIEADVFHPLHYKIMCQGIGSSLNYNFNNYKNTELDYHDCKRFSELRTNDIVDGDNWLYVFPLEWELYGGFIIKKETLFLNLLNLSSLMRDDFDVYDESLNNVIVFRGDRSGDELSLLDITIRGNFFNFFFDLIAEWRNDHA